MSTSRAELMYDEIVAEFEAITTVGGYRTNPAIKKIIRDLDKITAFPEIAVVMGTEEVSVGDSAVTVFDAWIPIYVIGAVKADTDIDDNGTNLSAAAEALLHDIKRVVAGISTKYINQQTVGTGGAWNLALPPGQNRIKFYRLLGLGENANTGLVGTEFVIHLRNLDADFDT